MHTLSVSFGVYHKKLFANFYLPYDMKHKTFIISTQSSSEISYMYRMEKSSQDLQGYYY